MKAEILKALAICSALVLTSCSLKENVLSNTQVSNYYRNATEIQTGLNACYTPLRKIYSNSGFWQMTECHTDLLYLNSTSQDNAICNIAPSRAGCAPTLWQSGYQGVSRANTMIEVIKRAESNKQISVEESGKLMAEAIIMRAFFYYLLTSSFGDVPFYEEEVTEENRVRISSLPRMSADDTRAAMITELWEALMPADMGGKESLPLRRTYEEGIDYRAGAAVGLFLGGRMALWNKDWEKAVGFFSQIEKIYGELSRYPLTDIPFSQKYTKECIWEVPQEYEPSGLQIVGGIAPFSMPVRRMVYDENDEAVADSTHCFYNGIAIPELGYDSRIVSCARPTKFLYQSLLPYYSSDLRTGEYANDSFTQRGGSGTLAWNWAGFDPTTPPETWTEDNRRVMFFANVASASGVPWLGNKFWCWDMKYNRDYNNYKIFRYAGALLGLSEAYLMQEDMPNALKYLNMVRNRAGLPDLTTIEFSGSSLALLEEIRNECGKELLGEFQRKFDLVRWGIWYDRTKQYNGCTRILNNMRPCHRYWPIPADQVAKSNGALDNKEYGE